MLLELDHLAVAAETLAEGVEYVEDLLGVKMAPGGQHPLMGTHNRLLSLGPDVYLEVIAIDPDATDPGRARWFGLDEFSGEPRLTNWIARSEDLKAAKNAAPAGIGEELALSRGDLRWRMLVPDSGNLPFGGAYPALICWDGDAHPAAMLPDAGFLMRGLKVTHPKAAELKNRLEPRMDLSRIQIKAGITPSLVASIQTPKGVVELS